MSEKLTIQDKLDQLEDQMTLVLETLQGLAEVTEELSKLAPTKQERKYVQKKIKQHEESLIDEPVSKCRCYNRYNVKCGRCQ